VRRAIAKLSSIPAWILDARRKAAAGLQRLKAATTRQSRGTREALQLAFPDPLPDAEEDEVPGPTRELGGEISTWKNGK